MAMMMMVVNGHDDGLVCGRSHGDGGQNEVWEEKITKLQHFKPKQLCERSLWILSTQFFLSTRFCLIYFEYLLLVQLILNNFPVAANLSTKCNLFSPAAPPPAKA